MISTLLLVAVAAGPVEAVTLKVTLEKPAVYAQAPVGLVVWATVDPIVADVRGISMYHSYLSVGIADESGKTVYESSEGAHRCGGRFDASWRWKTANESNFKHLLVLNEWHSLDLPPGKYQVSVDADRIGILLGDDVRTLPNGATAGIYKGFSINKHWELPLQILGEDDEAVRREYATLLDIARDRSNKNREDVKRALDLLTYCREPLALPYQLQLFLDDETTIRRFADFHSDLVYDLPMRFIESNSSEAAAALAEFLKPMDKTKDEMNALVRYEPRAQIVLWTLFELHDKGNPAVTAITAPVVARHVRPSDPRPVPGMD